MGERPGGRGPAMRARRKRSAPRWDGRGKGVGGAKDMAGVWGSGMSADTCMGTREASTMSHYEQFTN